MNYKLFSLVSGTLILSSLSASGQKNNTKPNILFILCDDMGYGDLGCYGQPFIRTPHLDAMASEGMRFTQAYAGSPVSAPSRASFMTGQHTGHCEYGATRNIGRRPHSNVWQQQGVCSSRSASL